MDKHANAIIQGSSPMQVSDVAKILRDEGNQALNKSIPFMAYNRATRRAAQKQAKRMLKNSKK
jgi:hypothetical protein